MKNLGEIRKEYSMQNLDEKDVNPDPINQFTKWWSQAVESNIDEVNAMTLATATPDGKPSARIVLLKGFDENGFIFFTNYQSSKAIEIMDNPNVALIFFWKELERQIRIEGTAVKVSAKDSESYFNSRPDESKLGAWASPQSKVIQGREEIEKNAAEYKVKFSGGNIPRPPHWGGYIIQPFVIEFWQGRPGRLHDRIRYTSKAEKNNSWKIERLAP